jgi:hypothetical protein
MTPLKWLIPTCTAAGGLAVGLFLGAAMRGDPGVVPGIAAPQARSASADHREVRGADPSALSLDDVRRVVREELIASKAGRDGATIPSSESASPHLPDAAAVAAGEEARRVLGAAIARRQWTREDAEALRARFHAMSGEEQDELLRQFSVAVNQGRLVVETDQVPF